MSRREEIGSKSHSVDSSDAATHRPDEGLLEQFLRQLAPPDPVGQKSEDGRSVLLVGF